MQRNLRTSQTVYRLTRWLQKETRNIYNLYSNFRVQVQEDVPNICVSFMIMILSTILQFYSLGKVSHFSCKRSKDN